MLDMISFVTDLPICVAVVASVLACDVSTTGVLCLVDCDTVVNRTLELRFTEKISLVKGAVGSLVSLSNVDSTEDAVVDLKSYSNVESVSPSQSVITSKGNCL